MTRAAFTWQLHWPTTLFVFALLPCLLALGLWQWHRADEKRALQQQFEALQMAAPIGVAQLAEAPANYTRTELRGQYDNTRSFLLDNRVLHGRVGFEVLTPFLAEDSRELLLVNRGWIAGDPARRRLPAIPAINGVAVLRGYLYRAADNPLVENSANVASWPRVIDQIDFARMPALLDAPVYPFTLRLDAGADGALAPEWPVVASSPEKHVAYAVQWFAMAVVLMLMWVLRSSNLREWLRSHR